MTEERPTFIDPTYLGSSDQMPTQTLRERLIEAGADVLVDWEDFTDWHHTAGLVLDAMIEVLELHYPWLARELKPDPPTMIGNTE